jgi:hypothetical protein
MPKQQSGISLDVQYSKYNEAAQQISRLHELWLKISELRRKGRLFDWNFELDSVWTELAGDKNCSPEDENKFYSFMPQYVNAKKNPALLYQVLLKKHVFLKRLQDSLGKGAAYNKKDDSGM